MSTREHVCPSCGDRVHFYGTGGREYACPSCGDGGVKRAPAGTASKPEYEYKCDHCSFRFTVHPSEPFDPRGNDPAGTCPQCGRDPGGAEIVAP